MATYVNDLRLKEIGTGESSGTWGTETNTNLELIGEALGFGTEAITTNADTHTTTVADGSTDPGRAMYIKYTGTLDSACTITIAPNTMSRMHFIENGTSGSQNIIISQGTGANVTIPAGDVKAVYLDGAGSGAAVADAFASLNTVDLKVEDDLTVTDDVSIGGALTLTGNGDFNGDLDVDGTTNLDVVDIDGAVDMATTLTLGGNADFNGDLDVDGTTNLDAVDIDGAVQLDATLTVGVDDTGYDVKLFGATSGAYMLWDASADALILAGSAGLSVQEATVSGVFKANGGVVFNEDSADVDFRIEGNGQANLFVVNGGTDDIGIGMADPTFSTGNGMQFADNFYLGFGTGNGTRPDFSIHGDNNGLGFACGTGSDDTDITFDTSGNVAINVGTAAAKLHVKSAGASTEKAFHISDSNDNDTFTVQGGGRVTCRFFPLVINNDTGHSVTSGARFFLDGTTYDTIFDSVGRLLVGTTAVYSDTNDAMVINGGRSNFTASGISSGAFNRQTSTGDIVAFLYNGSGKGSISTDGSNVAYNTSSDARLKNVLGEAKGLNIVTQLNPVNFEWKETGKTQDGLIAQEVEKLIPEAVSTNEHTGFYEMDYSKVVTPLVKAVQELEARITRLEG